MGIRDKIRGAKNRMGAKKFFALCALATLMCSGIGYAAWMLTAGDSYDAVVVSDGEAVLTLTQSFSDLALNTTLANDTKTTSMIIGNANGNITMTASIDVVKTDNTDACTDYLSDCSVTTMLNGVLINDQDVITLISGANSVNSTVYCSRFSCPQNLTSTVTFSE